MLWTLVTGGAKGLGAEICRQLAQKGQSIVVHYNTSKREAQEVVKGCRGYGVAAESIQGDFSTLQSTRKFMHCYTKEFHHTQNLINNVGNYLIKNALQTSLEEWVDLFQTNLLTPIALIQGLMPSILSLRGSVVNIGVAGVSSINAETTSTAYTMTKLGLWMLTRSLAAEYAPHQVRVNMISPGLLENAIDINKILPLIPMERAGTLEETARVVAFLLDSANSYITGQNIEISGGIKL